MIYFQEIQDSTPVSALLSDGIMKEVWECQFLARNRIIIRLALYLVEYIAQAP